MYEFLRISLSFENIGYSMHSIVRILREKREHPPTIIILLVYHEKKNSVLAVNSSRIT